MSLIGIDVGTSAMKAAAYREDGGLLASASGSQSPLARSAGQEELDPEAVWTATLTGLKELVAAPMVKRDPPTAIAVSASGSEAFLVDREGVPLGPCILSGDTRGARIEKRTAALASPEEWLASCGHFPERMDPVNRLMWLRENNPCAVRRADKFVGWHEFLTLRLCGLAAIDHSLAAKWLLYDFATSGWSEERLSAFEIDAGLLPEILPWGSEVGTLHGKLARELGLRTRPLVGVGGFDSSCAALGAGVSRAGTTGVISGSWEMVVAPIGSWDAGVLSAADLQVVPHPGEAPFAVLAHSPNGTAVIDWTTELLGSSARSIQSYLIESGPGPSPVAMIPHLSGAISPWKNGRDYRGALLGLNLSSTRTDIVKACLEGIAYDLVYALDLLREARVLGDVLRVAGGGSRSEWWMQLKADLTGIPVEVTEQEEPGAWGAALLAGVTAGVYESAGPVSESTQRVARRFEPDEERAPLHEERIALHKDIVETIAPKWERLV